MTQRDIRRFDADQLWREWQSDIQRIYKEAVELFAARRIFREIAELFRTNERLQAVGGNLWDWMSVNYANFVIMRIRREIDTQGNTVGPTQLLREDGSSAGRSHTWTLAINQTVT